MISADWTHDLIHKKLPCCRFNAWPVIWGLLFFFFLWVSGSGRWWSFRIFGRKVIKCRPEGLLLHYGMLQYSKIKNVRTHTHTHTRTQMNKRKHTYVHDNTHTGEMVGSVSKGLWQGLSEAGSLLGLDLAQAACVNVHERARDCVTRGFVCVIRGPVLRTGPLTRPTAASQAIPLWRPLFSPYYLNTGTFCIFMEGIFYHTDHHTQTHTTLTFTHLC